MASVLDNIDIILADGDLEVFRQWVEAKLESKDKQIAHLLHRIQKLETKIDILEQKVDTKLDILEQKVDTKLDIGRFEYEMAMREV